MLSFVEDNATSWSLPGDTLQPSKMLTMLNKGELYLKVNNDMSGSLHGQMRSHKHSSLTQVDRTAKKYR
ncbi:MAG: hypothetical protein JKX67_12265 [Colwellia sp.]|nr:hypothetical protein [Colwellia sp.]